MKRNLFGKSNLGSDLKERAVRSGTFTMASQGARFVLRTIGTIVLARLLTPADYGLIGMVSVVVNFAMMFRDAGLSMATIQAEEITREQISTLFWVNIMISTLLGLCVLASSPLVAWFYGEPELAAVTAVLSLSFLISGLAIQHRALQQRHLRFGTFAAIEVASETISLVVMIALALLGCRYWSLVAGMLVKEAGVSLLTLATVPWLPGRMRRGSNVRGMLGFGIHLTGFNFINYFARNADRILIGRFIGADSLGLYTKAYQLFLLPITQIRLPINRVAVPVLSSLRNEPQRYAQVYQRVLDIMSTLTVPLAMYCIVEGEFIIRLVLGHQWMGAVPVFRILAITGLIQTAVSTRGLVLISCGLSERYFWMGLWHSIIVVISFIAGVPFGIEGVATGYAVASYATFIPLLGYSFATTPVTLSLFFSVLLPPLAAGAASGLAVLGARHIWGSESLVMHLAYLGLFAMMYIVLTLSRRSTRETARMMLSGSGLMPKS